VARFRDRRVADAIRERLSEALLRSMHDPRLRRVQITAVRMSRDLRTATVLFSVYEGGETARQEAAAALAAARGGLRREVGVNLRLKSTPELRFVPDLSADHAAHIAEVLRELGEAPGAGSGAAGANAGPDGRGEANGDPGGDPEPDGDAGSGDRDPA
jgi:ribosome-binding factor A